MRSLLDGVGRLLVLGAVVGAAGHAWRHAGQPAGACARPGAACAADGATPSGEGAPVAGGFADEGLAPLGHLGGAVRAAATDGARIWYGEGSGLSVLDAGATVPVPLGHVALPPGADVYSLALAGGQLVVGAGDGAYTYAVGNGASLGFESFLPSRGPVTGVAVHRGYVYLSEQSYGVVVAHLGAAGELDVIGGRPAQAGVAGSAAGAEELVGLPGDDLGLLFAPADGPPVVVGHLDVGGPVADVEMSPGQAYIVAAAEAGKAAGFGVAAVDDPRSPALLGWLRDTPLGRLTLDLPYLYLTGGDVHLLDVADPASPVDVFAGPGPYAALHGAGAAARQGKTLAVAAGDRLAVEDVADPLNPRERGVVAAAWPLGPMAFTQGRLLLARGSAGLDFVRLADPAHPAWDLTYNAPGGVLGVAAVDGLAYLSTGEGAQAMDVTTATPGLLGTFAADWPATPWLAANAAYVVAVDPAGLHVAVATGGLPMPRGRMDFHEFPDWPAGVPAAVAVEAAVAYVALGASGVGLADLTDPDRPRSVGRLSVPGGANALAASEGTLLVGTDTGWRAYDTSAPLRPVELRAGDLGAVATDVALEGTNGLVATDAGVARLDLARVQGEELTGTFGAAGPVGRATWADAHVVAQAHGLLVLGADGTPAPTRVPWTPTPPPPLATAAGWPLASPTPTVTATRPVEPTSTSAPGPRRFIPWASSAHGP